MQSASEYFCREPEPLVAIIIPCREVDDYVRRCLHHIHHTLAWRRYEVFVIDDEICPGYPAMKRNYAMEKSKADIFAFIDSDAYPSREWLRNAVYLLRHHDAVCGPGVLPSDAPFCEVVADAVYRTLPYSYRVHPGRPRNIAEYPTFNLVVKREVATPYENYLTGEDSLFCRRIKSGIYYHPSVLVYHSRRGAFKPLWKQVGTYGRHRGNFIKQAFLAWISSVFVYSVNFIKGLFIRRPS